MKSEFMLTNINELLLIYKFFDSFSIKVREKIVLYILLYILYIMDV